MREETDSIDRNWHSLMPLDQLVLGTSSWKIDCLARIIHETSMTRAPGADNEFYHRQLHPTIGVPVARSRTNGYNSLHIILIRLVLRAKTGRGAP